jgi:NAD(P)-dependent dehydrogenase (short-subunit alcohol dehydrogenase family)
MASTKSSRMPLAGRVALVAGATRGAGRGIARALGEAGATVCCTGRSTKGKPSPYGRPETIDETAGLINAAGGTAIAVRVDHTKELLSFWELAREYGFTDYDGRRPDWGRHKIDFSALPAAWVDWFRTGTNLEIRWLAMLAARARKFRAKIPT